MSCSKGTSSHRNTSGSLAGVTSGEEHPKELCSRVRKACNRCRLRKVKCNGRVPCARCEQDHATCTTTYDLTGIKNLRKSYIASLEEQQISLLSALRELHRKMPDNINVCDTIEQLQRKGFEIESLKFNDQYRHSEDHKCPRETASPKTVPQVESWESGLRSMEFLQSIFEQPVTSYMGSDFLRIHSDTPPQSEFQYYPQPVRWQSAGSLFDRSIPQHIHPIFDPSSGQLINP